MGINQDIQTRLEGLRNDFENELSQLRRKEELVQFKAFFLGKKGPLADVMSVLKKASIEEKKKIGPAINELKAELAERIQSSLEQIERKEIEERLASNPVDLGLSDLRWEKGIQGAGFHPTEIVQQDIERIFLSMGFDILDGPHIEDDYHNFEALNIPENHPARDMQDTFWFKDKKHLLRTHTSTIQVRGMADRKPPFRFVGPGKVFRSERTDASHEFVFHQLEGMMVDRGVSVSHLTYFMKTLLSEIFQKETKIRLRPGYFPFVEPGFELDIECLICGGKGCSVCKHSGWVELLPCGMVHPKVLEMGGVDPSTHSGFAFGLGLDRLVMMRYGIDDIRLLHSADLRFHKQFSYYEGALS